jgi:hypothetical protein
MSFLRRLLGSERDRAAETPAAESPASPAELEEDERRYELEIARDEQRRLSELQQRQLKYADRAWTPPAQGGSRRADDEDAEGETSDG